MAADDEAIEEPLLVRLKRDTEYLRNHDIPDELLTFDQEADYVSRYLSSIRDVVRWSKSEALNAEIEFCVQNNLIRHMCAIAADFYARHEYTVDWRPVGFFKGGGSYKEIKLEFRKYDVDTRTSRTYTGTLSRCVERGERYTLIVNGETEKDWRRATGIADILNILGVPRTYLDGLFDMIDYGMETVDNEYTQKRSELARMRYLMSDLKIEIEKHSQRLQAVKRSNKWRRKRHPVIRPGDTASMPPVPSMVESLPEASNNYRDCSGIYFLWDKARACAYVGKSRNVGNRLSRHDKATEEHAVSVLPLPVVEIHYAELYYIWLLRPYLNREGVDTAKEVTKNTKRTA